MSLESNFIFLVIFGVVGFITEKIWGTNPYKMYSDISMFVILLVVVAVILPAINNPEYIEGNVDRLVNLAVNILPGVIVGDMAGSFVAKITGEAK